MFYNYSRAVGGDLRLLPLDEWDVVLVSIKEDVGTRIRVARLQAGLKIGDLAGALNVSRQRVLGWESGGGILDIDELTRISLVLGVSSLALLGIPEPEGHDEATDALEAAVPLLRQLDTVPPERDNLEVILALVTAMAESRGQEEAHRLVLEMFDVIDEVKGRVGPREPRPPGS